VILINRQYIHVPCRQSQEISQKLARVMHGATAAQWLPSDRNLLNGLTHQGNGIGGDYCMLSLCESWG